MKIWSSFLKKDHTKEEESMLKVRFFLNEPRGKTWNHFEEIMPRLGEKYDIEIETISKPRADFATAEYLEQGLPKAPAIMVEDEILIEGADIS